MLKISSWVTVRGRKSQHQLVGFHKDFMVAHILIMRLSTKTNTKKHTCKYKSLHKRHLTIPMYGPCTCTINSQFVLWLMQVHQKTLPKCVIILDANFHFGIRNNLIKTIKLLVNTCWPDDTVSTLKGCVQVPWKQ